jgi:hypothetical protein
MTNANGLAMRDPALAALVGAFAGTTSFGGEVTEDSEFGADFGFGDEMYGEFGDEMSGEFGFGDDAAVVAAAPPKPTPQQALALWNNTHQAKVRGQRRAMMLDPNKGSALKVEGYLFPLSQNVTLGVATPISMTNQPDVTIRPQRACMNPPTPAFISISEMRVANVAVTVGGGTSFDGFFMNAGGVGVRLDLPTLSPSNRATVTGTSTTLVPPGFVNAATFPFSVAFIGPASMAG